MINNYTNKDKWIINYLIFIIYRENNMANSAGDTLSLNDLAGATGITQGANVSLGTIKWFTSDR